MESHTEEQDTASLQVVLNNLSIKPLRVESDMLNYYLHARTETQR